MTQQKTPAWDVDQILADAHRIDGEYRHNLRKYRRDMTTQGTMRVPAAMVVAALEGRNLNNAEQTIADLKRYEIGQDHKLLNARQEVERLEAALNRALSLRDEKQDNKKHVLSGHCPQCNEEHSVWQPSHITSFIAQCTNCDAATVKMT